LDSSRRKGLKAKEEKAVNGGNLQMPILLKEQKEEFKRFQKNLQWFQESYEDLRSQYAGEYVVVDDNKVVLHGKNARDLIEELRKTHADIGAFVIEFVSKEKMELIL
jgi:Ribonuclease G/E